MSSKCDVDHTKLSGLYITVINSNEGEEKKAVCPECGEAFGVDVFPEIENKVRSD